jgi:hypothetical protein
VASAYHLHILSLIRIFLEDQGNLVPETFVNGKVICIETCMDLAVETVRILCLLEVTVLDPVLNVVAAPEGGDDLVDVGSVAHESVDFGDWMVDVEDVGEGMLASGLAGPWNDALVITEGHGCKFDYLHRLPDIVVRLPHHKGAGREAHRYDQEQLNHNHC